MSVGAKSDLDEVLSRHGIGLSGAEFVAELDAGLSGVASPITAPLSAGEIAFLREHGGPRASEVLDQDPSEAMTGLGRSVAERLAGSLAASVSIPEAALLLGVDRSRVSQRISQGTLWAFTAGRSKRLPRWQFTTGGRLLPGLAVVIAAIPRGLAAQTVAAFMAEPQPELADRTPSQHLAEGGDPSDVAELLAGLGLW
jgi:hypothetical protein